MNKAFKERDKRRNQLLRKNSRAEEKFAKMLNKANIFYIREKCCFSEKGNWCYIDFYLPKFSLGIEIDGREHNSGYRAFADVRKTRFLEEERGISTIRYTNEEVFAMENISLISIIKKAGKTMQPNSRKLAYERNQKRLFLDEYQKYIHFNADSKIWMYDKTKDATFTFSNLYVLKKSTGIKVKYLINAIAFDDDINKSHLYIFANSEDLINERIEEYYETLWSGENE